LGARDLDAPGTQKIVKKSGNPRLLPCAILDERGMREVMSDALKYAMDDTAGIAVSLDMDFVDPADAPGVGQLPCVAGVTLPRKPISAMENESPTPSPWFSLESPFEINPILDEPQPHPLCSGVEKLVLSGLGPEKSL